MAVEPVGTKNDWEVNLLGAISATDIISIIKKEIEDFDWDDSARETGEVIWVGDGIATIYGIDHAMYGEIVTFENGVKGMVVSPIVIISMTSSIAMAISQYIGSIFSSSPIP